MLKRRNIKKLHTGNRHQFNLFDLRSETALNKDGGVEALSHVEDQQVGAIIQRPLATHVSLSINFGSYSQREFRKHKHKSRLQILPFMVVGKYQERVKSTHFCEKVFDDTPLSLLGRSPCWYLRCRGLGYQRFVTIRPKYDLSHDVLMISTEQLENWLSMLPPKYAKNCKRLPSQWSRAGLFVRVSPSQK